MNISVKINRLKEVQIVILFFVTIYFPPICQINTVYIIGAIAWVYLLLRYNLLVVYINVRKMLIFSSVLLLTILYIFGRGYLYTGEMQRTVGGLVYLLVCVFPMIIAIIIELKRMKASFDVFLKILIYAGTIQGWVAILAYMLKPVQAFLLRFLLYVMQQDILEYWGAKRLYGWSNTLTYSMPVVQGIIGTLALIYALKKERKYLITVPIIWLSGILNARTTLVVIGIGMLCAIYVLQVFSVKNMKLLAGMLGTLFISYYLLMSVFVNTGLHGSWIVDGFSELGALLRGEKIGYFTYLDVQNNASAFLLPTGIDLFFGVGMLGTNSDIGYIHNIWNGGILLMLVILIFISALVLDMNYRMKMSNENEQMRKGISWLMLGVFLVVNVKGNIFGLNEFMNLFLLMYSFICLVKKNPEMVT